MANLLPVTIRRAVLLDHEARFAVIAVAIILLLGLLACAAIIPSYVVVTAGSVATPAVDAADTQAAADQKEMLRSQALVTQLAPLASTSSAADVVVRAITLRPKGVHVSGITYAAGSPSQLILTGTADAHEEIDAYRNILRDAGTYSSVSVPVSALVGSTNGDFTLTLSGTF